MYLSTYIIQTGSYFDFNQHTPERVFHMLILGLVVGLRDSYIIQFNQESGFGRYDVMFIPKNKRHDGILLEFKVAEVPEDLVNKAQEALNQIKDKQYIEKPKILNFINFFGENTLAANTDRVDTSLKLFKFFSIIGILLADNHLKGDEKVAISTI
ncbi:MAG: PD-(D/E)XK nuclease domain-containing protein [Candidatus Midichloria mitochondrii]|uniref:PD-(D/E)XK nuclease domain-containing protein n=1 Tax=Candidatus Midichloria mitochondrii TaxID=234827 RepID=UPI001F2CBEB7|nr:PD-(D/E)XK nuclease domain-containing protein [Candidatus Midichloria mitochondrii]